MWTIEERFDTAEDGIEIEFRARSGRGPFAERLVPEDAVVTIREGAEGHSTLDSVSGGAAGRIERRWEAGEALQISIIREDDDSLHGRVVPVPGTREEFTVEWSKSTFPSKLGALSRPSEL
ncbi:hypothetical protein [Natronorarus salvus]|uniref:hypothetical protein n=1 Tax=Natronorarus salvus TaxID=3117733 RepID=UPI002F26ADBA